MDKIKNPPAVMRSAPFWSWNDKLDENELRRQIREMANKGWGGYFMHSRVGLVTGYLSDEWMSLIRACADEAEKTNTYAWLYDEDKWPSGFAGGEVPRKDKAFRSRALVLVKSGSKALNDTVLAEITIEDSDYQICCRISELNSIHFNGTSYVDLMSPDAVKEFINCTHERYKKSCGEYFGKSIPGIFTDEPCYLVYNQYNVPAAPWSDFLPEFFVKMKGYNILDHLPEIFFDINDYRKIRFDYYDAATELFKQSFTKQYYDWCNDNDMLMTGHFMAEDGLRYQTQWSGDVMTHYEYMHWPGIDKLGRNIDQVVTVKQVTSAVDQLGKERAFCEVYGCMGGQGSFFHRKWIGDWQAALGISFINHHLSLYSMRGERKRDYPANLFYQQPWWDDEREFADYQGRLCALAANGERIVDILLIQPLTSVWAEYSPKHIDTNFLPERKYDEPFNYISHRLLQEKLDYHYGNENLMSKYGSVNGKRLKIGSHIYKCIIMPQSCNIKSTTLSLLVDYGKLGGEIIVIGNLPSMIDGVKSKVEIPGAKIVSTVDEAVDIVSAHYPNRIRVIDTITNANAPSALVHSRHTVDSSWHLIVNSSDKREIHARIEIPECFDEPTAILDLYTGDLYKVPDNKSIELTIYPAGSLALVCGNNTEEAADTLPSCMKSGIVFNGLSKQSPVTVIEDLKCSILDVNTLLLNDFILEMDGAKVYEGPICGSWHKYFYPAKEGTPFRATYTFDSEVSINDCFAVIEAAENLDNIYFNGTQVEPMKEKGELGAFDPEKSWLDINFTKVPLPKIKPGINTLTIEGKKSNNITGPGSHLGIENWQEHYPTEAEEIYICGNFCVKQLSDSQFMLSEFTNTAGYNITSEGFPFYCGKIKFSASFRLAGKPDKKVHIRLNGASMASAQIMINGKPCGSIYTDPMMLEVTNAVKSGENNIEVIMSTTLVNAFGPNRMAGIKDQTGIGPGSFINMNGFKEGYELFDFGLESIGLYVE